MLSGIYGRSAAGRWAMADTGNWWQRAAASRMNRRRLVARGALTVGAFGLALGIGCGSRKSVSQTAGSSAGTETPQPGGTLNVSQIASATTLDVQRTTSFYTIQPAGA